MAFNTYGRRRRSNWKAENVPYELWMKITAFSLANLQPYTVTYFRESHSENEYHVDSNRYPEKTILNLLQS